MLDYETLYQLNLIRDNAWRLFFLNDSADKMTSLHRCAVIQQTSNTKFDDISNIESLHVATRWEAQQQSTLRKRGHLGKRACSGELV